MATLTLIIPGEPKGKGRPKFAKRGEFSVAYTPKETVSYENLVKTGAQKLMEGMPLMEGEVIMTVVADFSIPASTSKKKRAAMLRGDIRPTKKPDADNILKIIADSLNKIVYRDDAQIVDCTVSRYYAEKPGVKVTIEERKVGML